MHIPDGFLDAKTWIPAAGLAAVAVWGAVRKCQVQLGERQVPLLGMVGAFLFAAQMVNFPVAGGTSGHLLGGTLAAVLVGPAAATVVMTAILLIQALLFQDGGITALGANVLNMAFVGVYAGYGLCRIARRVIPGHRGLMVGAFFGGWASVVASASLAALQLAFAGTLPLEVALPALLYWHALIGVGEGAITAAVLHYLLRLPGFSALEALRVE